jgi:hypothetical protein
MGEGEVKIVGLPSRERGRLETVELPLMGRGKKNHLVCRRQWCCSAWGAKVRIFLSSAEGTRVFLPSGER